MKYYRFKRLVLLVMALAGSISADAESFTKSGVHYNIIDKEGFAVEVVAGETKYQGTVTIPATVTHDNKTYNVKVIGGSAFYDCTDLVTVEIGSKVEEIGTYAFWNCNSLKNINWSNNIRSYGNGAFHGCSSLEHAELSSSLESMGSGVTKQLIENTYVTPAITEDSELVVVFDSDSGQSKKGDLNNDGKVDVADHVELTEIIMSERY